jgi:hypothetical protein
MARSVKAVLALVVAYLMAEQCKAQGDLAAAMVPTALNMAKWMVKSEDFSVISSGSSVPRFKGPVGNVKIISWWNSNDFFAGQCLIPGAVRFSSATKGKPAKLELRFTIKAKVHEYNLHGTVHCLIAVQGA